MNPRDRAILALLDVLISGLGGWAISKAREASMRFIISEMRKLSSIPAGSGILPAITVPKPSIPVPESTKQLEYTFKSLEDELNLAEKHASEARMDPSFCVDCLKKHLSTIRGLLSELIRFKSWDPGNASLIEEAYSRVDSMHSQLGSASPEQIESWAPQIRGIRKAIVSILPRG